MTPPLTDVRELSQVAYGFMASKALFSALDLGLFGHVSQGAGEVGRFLLPRASPVTGWTR